MKILAVSLLRLGDFLMLTPVIRGFKREKKVKALHALVHPELLMLKPLFPEVDHWHVLDRRTLQNALGTSDSPFFLAHDLLMEQIEGLSMERFDCVLNLTHTKFSGWVSGAIEAKDRIGLHYDINGQPGIHSSWFQYLNNHVVAGAKEVFHLSDVLYYGSGLTQQGSWELADTPKGLNEAEPFTKSGPFIALQTLTSDSKKNWPQSAWLRAMVQLQTFQPQWRFIILGAPAEKERLNGLCEQARARGVKTELAICSMEGALAIVRQAKVLITGDTSIKHLACGTKTPVVELSLGSSDYRKTGVYKQDSLIVQSAVGCAPCPHSKACHQPNHLCAEQISPEAVALLTLHLAYRRFAEIRRTAYEYQNEITVLQTHICPMGFWLALPLGEQNENQIIHAALERSTWKFILQREYLNPLAQFGTEGLQIKRWLQSHLTEWNTPRLNEGLSFIESETANTDREINGLINTLRRITDRAGRDLDFEGDVEDLKTFFENNEGTSTVLPWLAQLQEVYTRSDLVPITGLRKVQSRLDEVFQKVQVKLKLIRSLKSQLTEKI